MVPAGGVAAHLAVEHHGPALVAAVEPGLPFCVRHSRRLPQQLFQGLGQQLIQERSLPVQVVQVAAFRTGELLWFLVTEGPGCFELLYGFMEASFCQRLAARGDSAAEVHHLLALGHFWPARQRPNYDRKDDGHDGQGQDRRRNRPEPGPEAVAAGNDRLAIPGRRPDRWQRTEW